MNNNILISLFASLTLGLAPFRPEPHIVGKIRWVLGGGEGMVLEDYADLAMHGLPWIFLIYFIVEKFLGRKPKQEDVKT